MRFGYADTPLGQVHYREAGSGPAIVLLHESPISGRIYEPSLSFLGQRARAIAPDTPGYGASEPPPEPPTIEEYAERLTLFLDALGLEQVALVGNHTGGGIAAQMAVSQPDRVRALIMIGSPLFGEEEGRDWLENYIPTFEIEPKGEHLTWLWDRYRNIWGDDTPPWLFDLATTEFLRTGTRYHWGYRAAFLYRLERALPSVRCPTLFLTSEGDMLRNKNEPSVALTPGAEGHIVEGPHGQFPARRPEEFAQEVFRFLTRVGYLPPA